MRNRTLLILILLLLTASAVRGEKVVDARTLRVINHGWWAGGIDQCPPALTPFSRLPYAYKDPESSLLGTGWAFSTTAGVGVRFATNSKKIGVRYTLKSNAYMANMTPIGSKGMDLYVYSDEQQRWLYAASHKPTNSTEQASTLGVTLDGAMHECVLYLPLYDSVTSLEIVLDDGATITTGRAALPDRRCRIVGYGSSIFQGASASRTGLVPTAMASRALGCEFINMGISGSAQMHPEVACALADIPDVDIYVLDPLPNCIKSHVDNLAVNFIETLLKAHPDAQYVMVEMPPVPAIYLSAQDRDKYVSINPAWRALFEKYEAAYPGQFHYMAAPEIYGDCIDYTADEIHYTDYGFHLYTEALIDLLQPLVKLEGEYAPAVPRVVLPEVPARLHGYRYMALEPVATASGYTIEVAADSLFEGEVWRGGGVGPFDSEVPWRAREIVLADTTLNGRTDYYARIRADFIAAADSMAATAWSTPVPFRYLPPFPGGEHWIEENAIAGVEPSGTLPLVTIVTDNYEPVCADSCYMAVCNADSTTISITAAGDAFDKKEYRVGNSVYTPALTTGYYGPFVRGMMESILMGQAANAFEPVELKLNEQYIGLYFRTDTVAPAPIPADSLIAAIANDDIYSRDWEALCSVDSLARRCVLNVFLGDTLIEADALRYPRFVKNVQKVYRAILLQDPDGLLDNIKAFTARIEAADATDALLWDYYATEPLEERHSAANELFAASLDTLATLWAEPLTAHILGEVVVDSDEPEETESEIALALDEPEEETTEEPVGPALQILRHSYADGMDIFRGTDVDGVLTIPFGYEATALYVNGEDRTEILNPDGTFVLPAVDADTHIEAALRKIDSGIATLSTTEGRIAATVDRYGRVSVNSSVELLAASGMVIAQGTEFQLPQRGIYLLRRGAQTLKITW